ncbi:TIR domain-containing protein [Anaeromyxobacter sp. PSR-1]|uniref:TIR domain-containing protein n=1 Tax=Anaeromyxobacter sp. PSR-1 TaxID=1300915 RepID=UPI0005E4FFD8|nr:TIR domain-containing protein [Anaeromyxobacter sp. PSR-1]GAO05296.1 putative nucleotide-binding protein [Anaeromyxobacter sp. PSR-1]
MKDRFAGTSGRPNLIAALAQQRIIQHDDAIAQALASTGELVEFAAGETVVAQRATDSDVFFIISGDADVFVNNREVATRGPREVIGEMVAVDPTARRSATVKARTPLLCLKVSAPDFVAAGEGSAKFWRAIADMTGNRLRQRERFHRPANDVPVMFVGSSSEGLPVVGELEEAFKHDHALALHPWTKDVFGPSGVLIDDLLVEVENSDFALFVFGPDDKIASRGDTQDGPRDNVIFEMGLFVSRLGRERVFMLREKGTTLKIPSDLLGITPVTYVCKGGCTLGQALGGAVNEIRKAVRSQGAL